MRIFVLLWLLVSSGVAAAEPSNGAMPLPGDTDELEIPLEYLDRTISFDELPAARGTWKRDARMADQPYLLLATAVDAEHQLTLWVIEANGGRRNAFSLGACRFGANEYGSDGNSFPPNRAAGADGASDGILFAFRAKATDKAPVEQVVVFARRGAIFAARRELGGKRWTRLLRIDVARDAVLTAIGTVDPH